MCYVTEDCYAAFALQDLALLVCFAALVGYMLHLQAQRRTGRCVDAKCLLTVCSGFATAASLLHGCLCCCAHATRSSKVTVVCMYSIALCYKHCETTAQSMPMQLQCGLHVGSGQCVLLMMIMQGDISTSTDAACVAQQWGSRSAKRLAAVWACIPCTDMQGCCSTGEGLALGVTK
jgi:hypothetical protein